MDVATLKADLDFACNLLQAVSSVLPNGAKFQPYIASIQVVLDNETFLAVATALINSMALSKARSA